MLTFLKKLGSILVQVAGVATGIGPILKPFLGSGKTATGVITATNDLTSIASMVVQIETVFNTIPNSSGQQKFAALVPLVKNIISTSEVVAGKKIQNEDLFSKGATEVAQGMVDILNAIHPDEAEHA